MRSGHLTALLVVLAVAGCGGDDEPSSVGPGSSGTTTPSAPEAKVPQFELVETFALDYLGREPAVRKECPELDWVEDDAKKRELAPFSGTARTEILACDGVVYLAYIEYEDAAAAEAGLAPALLPYLAADETTVVMPTVGMDEPTASRFLRALRSQCACGEIIRPAA